eukprot:TRINITY_DN43485_c0_g1_i2.p1 TRINITY_DN43485_c0_g1~~TRINITY_DN43485_c0_g1_i2.p1  ORF type:complete len:164 (-),score=11.22 TRINITY_DN43485_c0_g1_i2:16-480(-)
MSSRVQLCRPVFAAALLSAFLCNCFVAAFLEPRGLCRQASACHPRGDEAADVVVDSRRHTLFEPDRIALHEGAESRSGRRGAFGTVFAAALACGLVAGVLNRTARAIDSPESAQSSTIVDASGLLTSSTEAHLDKLLRKLEADTGVKVMYDVGS